MQPLELSVSDRRGVLLRDGAGNGRKDVVSIRADQPDRADHDHQNNRQHHRVFSNILALLLGPEPSYKFCHSLASSELHPTDFPAYLLFRLQGMITYIVFPGADANNGP